MAAISVWRLAGGLCESRRNGVMARQISGEASWRKLAENKAKASGESNSAGA
jgi:hypothetical protein